MTENPLAPDPGPRPTEQQLSPDELIAAFGLDLDDGQLREQILAEMVRARKLAIASSRKATIESKAYEVWMSAYIKRYGTDEG